jgi:ribosomal protein L14E/L6E/L27E
MEYKQYEGVSPAAMDGSDWDNYTEGRGTERLNYDFNKENISVPKDYSVTDWKNDKIVLSSFEKLTDYLAEEQGLGSYIIDQAATGQNTDPAEYMRDLTMRLGAPLALANALDDAPEDVKEAFRTMKLRWDKAELTGAGETMEAIGDYASDFIFSPEGLATLGGILSGAVTGGTTTVASVAARKASQQAASKTLMNAVRATAAATAKNPYKASALMGATYGAAESHVAQELDMASNIQDKYSLGKTVTDAAMTAGFGVGLYAAGSKIANKYFRDGTRPPKEIKLEDAEQAFKEGVDAEFIPKSGALLVDEAARNLDSARSAWRDSMETAAKKFAEDLGGGEKTRKEVRAIIRAASNAEDTSKVKTNKIRQGLYTLASDLTGNFLGKGAGILSPIVKFSGTAKQLQQKLSHEFGITSELLTPQQKVVEKDLSEVQREVTGKYNERFRAIVDTLSLSEIDTKLATDINDALSKSLRSESPITHKQFDDVTNSAINKAATETKKLYQEMGEKLKDIRVIDKLVDNYVPRMWSRSAIEANPNKLLDLFVQKAGMGKAEARRTVNNMLDIKNQVDQGTSGGYFFSAKRKIDTIGNDADFEEFLNSDVMGALHAYTYQAGKSLAKHRVLGINNFKEFKGFYINRIRKEMTDNGQELTPKIELQLEKLYRTATGEGMDRYGKTAQTAVDAYSFTNRVALLGLATVSSLTEVFINMGKAGAMNSAKGFKEAVSSSHKTITKDMQSKLMSENDLTAKEALSEMRNFSIHVDQALAQVGDRLSGDELVNEGMQKASNKFFRITLLDQWTKFVQNVSFASGKNLINENINKLSTRYSTRALDSDGEVLAGELAELGIDWKKAVSWHKSGAKTNTEFYKADFLGGAARYTNSVVLQPTAMSGLKPLLFSNPKTAVMFQLLTYPAAFTNTILKGATKSLIKAPKRNAPKLLAAGTIMTGMARWTNYVRTDGRNERDKTEFEITKEAIARWGGNGLLLDSLKRAQTAAKYSKSNLAYATLPFGPAASDMLSMIQQGIIPTMGNKVPLVSGTYMGKKVLGEDYVRRYRKNLRRTQEDVFGGLIPEFDKKTAPIGYAKGGAVAAKAFKSLFKKQALVPETPFISESTSDKISKVTENLIDSDIINKAAQRLDNNLLIAKEEGIITTPEYDLLDLTEAHIVNELKSNYKTLQQIDSNPKFQEALEVDNLKDAKQKLREIQEDDNLDNDHILARRNIEDLEDDNRSGVMVRALVSNEIKGIKSFYDKAKIELSSEEVKKASVNKFDEDSLDFMHDYFKTEIKNTFPMLSDKGAFELARNAMVKVAAKGDVNFSRFKTPRIDVSPKKTKLLSPEARQAEQKKYIQDSEKKEPVYRVVSSYQNADYNISFPFAREVGTHAGSKGSADKVMIRDIALEFTGNDQDAAMRLMKQFTGNPANPKSDAYDKFFNYVTTQLRDTDKKIRPYTMQEGYIDVRKPLIVDEDMPSWRAEYIIQNEESIEVLIKAAKAQGAKITTSDIDTIDVLKDKSSDFVKYIGRDSKPYSTPLEKVEMDLQRAEFNMKFKDFINKLGFDSVKYRNTAEPSYEGEDVYSYILFEPEQFKLTSSKAFDKKDPRHGFALGSIVGGVTKGVKAFASKKASGLFSEAEKAAKQLQGSKPRAGQSFLNEMKNVTPDELEWTGAKERFGNNKLVTKEEVQEFFEDNDFDFEVQVGRSRPEEIEAIDDMPILARYELDEDDAFWAWAEENYPHDVDMLDDLVDSPDEFDAWFNSKQEEFNETTAGADFITKPDHLLYSFEGKDTQNYRELVISIPDKYKKVDLDYINMIHHPNSKNQIAHVRLADIEQADDAYSKTLLVDEIQSDAHQTATGKSGRGYVTIEKAEELSLKRKNLEKRRQEINNSDIAEEQKDELLEELLVDAEIDAQVFEPYVPELPLKKDKQWGAVGLRQAMKVAAEEGYDQVALTTGRLQAERNKKIGDINKVIFYKTEEGSLKDIDKGWSVQGVRNEDEGMEDFLIQFDSYEEGVEKLPKIIGKENTEKLLAENPDGSGDFTLNQPMTFKQGGQKYMDFYDGTLQKIWKRDFSEKYGVDIKIVEYVQGNKTVELPTIEVTDKMREDINRGLKMFAEGGTVDGEGSKSCKTVSTLKKKLAQG